MPMEATPWFLPGKWYTSPYDWDGEVRSQMPLLPQRVYLRDVTMREGEETVGAVISPNNRIDLALMLDDLGVAALGFPKLDSPEAGAALTKKFLRCMPWGLVFSFPYRLPADTTVGQHKPLRVEPDI